jgi:hypothetical protein
MAAPFEGGIDPFTARYSNFDDLPKHLPLGLDKKLAAKKIKNCCP